MLISMFIDFGSTWDRFGGPAWGSQGGPRGTRDLSRENMESFYKNPEVFTVSKSFFEIPVTKKKLLIGGNFQFLAMKLQVFLSSLKK